MWAWWGTEAQPCDTLRWWPGPQSTSPSSSRAAGTARSWPLASPAPARVPGHLARCCQVHPVYTPLSHCDSTPGAGVLDAGLSAHPSRRATRLSGSLVICTCRSLYVQHLSGSHGQALHILQVSDHVTHSETFLISRKGRTRHSESHVCAHSTDCSCHSKVALQLIWLMKSSAGL